jgi:hypothetical protein
MARVYLETSFLSACVSDRTDAKSVFRRDESRRWWVQQRRLHALYVSAEVVRELSAPNFRKRDEALALTAEADLLAFDEDVHGLARILVRERAMPGPEEAGDALHVAVATVHRIDVMLSWNVKHLANRNKVVHLREICRRIGYVAPEILTPDTFWESEEG